MPLLSLLFNIYIFLLGTAIGSFLNVIIYRLSVDHFSFFKSLGGLRGRSYCPHCKKQLSWQDLTPLISFLFLQGKCRYCKKKISWQYPLVELITGLSFLIIFNLKFLWVATLIPISASFNQFAIFNFINLFFLFFTISVLIIIFVYDLKHYLIPDNILFPAIIVTIFYRILDALAISGWHVGQNLLLLLANYVLAAILASGFFLSLFIFSRGRWMGFGDVKLAILLGLLLGLPNIFVGLFLAFFLGATIGIILMYAKKKGLKSEIPFAPFLIVGTLAALFFGNQIIHWYGGFFI